MEWVKFLLRLRETGTPIARMHEYAELRARGAGTTVCVCLKPHQTGLREQIDRLRAPEKALAEKIAIYRGDLAALQGKQEKGSEDD
ncbi:hypothetical protein GCM10022254_26500 [Actinomadura meridiana]|uniref:Uncharacterized protein n=1 Tax=Actinomadura meridiana TaxID=559626 RepID=A0ABP8C084_9ACTN